ncbi:MULTISPECIES: helix-turn-helix domain-containing protein [unclassified Nocardiopsis]|uniref:helix-turn-helix domain-containing protein n=1 Tax=Nocardiopsis TaxID=2013 RepID=UPI00387AA2ED
MTPPPTAWIEFGKLLRSIRTEAKLSQDELGKRIDRGRSTVSGYETGHRVPDVADVRAMDDALAAHGSLLRAREAAERTSRSPLWYQQVTEAEKHAVGIEMFHSALVPGRFQTPDYARSVLKDCRPGDAPANIDRLVKIRISMLPRLLSQNRPHIVVVLTEYVIRHSIGSPRIHGEQLDHLLKLQDEGTVQLLIVPSGTQNRAGVATGPFRIISFDDRLPLAYAEHASGGVIIDQRDEVRRLSAIFREQMSWSLTPTASVDLVKHVRGELA